MPWSATAPRPSSARNRCRSVTAGWRTAFPNGLDLTTRPASTEASAARTRSARTRGRGSRTSGRLHARPPTITVRPSAVTSTAGQRGLGRASCVAGEEERLREHLRLDRGRRDDGHAEQVARRRARRSRGSIRWWRSSPSRRQRRRSRPEVASAASSRARASASRRRSRSRRASRARPAGRRARCRRRRRRAHGPAAREDRGGAVDGVALGDAAEVEADAGSSSIVRAVDADAAAAAADGVLRDAPSRRDLVERPVVAGCDERVVDGRVEASARSARARRARARPRRAGRRRPRGGRRG